MQSHITYNKILNTEDEGGGEGLNRGIWADLPPLLLLAGFKDLPVNMMKTYMTNWLKVTKIDKNNKQKYNNISAILLSTVGQFWEHFSLEILGILSRKRKNGVNTS